MDIFVPGTSFFILFISIILAITYYLSNRKNINIASVIISSIICTLIIYTVMFTILLILYYTIGTLMYTYYVNLAIFLIIPSAILGIDIILLITVLKTITQK